MNATDVIRTALESTRNIATMYLGDLSDADLLVRPAPSANHIAWQLGHLIASEPHLGAMAGLEAKYPELPAGSSRSFGISPAKRNGCSSPCSWSSRSWR